MGIERIVAEYVDEIPDILIEGIIYISLKFGIAIHLCACGCGKKTVTPIEPKLNGWSLEDMDGKVTLRPSIGNFNGENPYHAHYFITNSKVEWL